MYLYEDRIRAVELYIKLGKRVRATIRQVGYPPKISLPSPIQPVVDPFVCRQVQPGSD